MIIDIPTSTDLGLVNNRNLYKNNRICFKRKCLFPHPFSWSDALSTKGLSSFPPFHRDLEHLENGTKIFHCPTSSGANE